MKKTILFFALGAFVIGCNQQSPEELEAIQETSNFYVSDDNEYAHANAIGGYGAEITEEGAISIAELESKIAGGSESMSAKVKAEVNKVCVKKGCWMTLTDGGEGDVRVTFKDYEFFVPRDIEGKTILASGHAAWDTTDVDMLKHLAEDEGLPQEEIDAITEPEFELVFIADGVLIY